MPTAITKIITTYENVFDALQAFIAICWTRDSEYKSGRDILTLFAVL